jgi:hypothetical protein
MTAKTQDSQKATSPSKLVQHGIDQSWGGQKGTEDPKKALADKFTKKPMDVGGKS